MNGMFSRKAFASFNTLLLFFVFSYFIYKTLSYYNIHGWSRFSYNEIIDFILKNKTNEFDFLFALLAGYFVTIFTNSYLSRTRLFKPFVVSENESELKKTKKDEEIYDFKDSSLIIKKTNDKIMVEIENITRRNNVNLSIGVSTTFIAILILGSTLITSKEFKDIQSATYHYVPRLLLSFFVEFFSFFFLRLYKSGIEEIKYYQNELVNIGFKHAAAEKAMASGNVDLQKMVIENFLNTERNFKLNKDETTISLEKHRMDNSNNQQLIDVFSQFINDKKVEKGKSE